MLLFGTWGGLIADRVDKRRLLYVTQAAAGVLALVLGLLDGSGAVRLWQVFLLASLLGFVNMFDNPARQTFVLELVGHDDLPNAVSLNSVVMNSARVIGPAIGGALIARWAWPLCFPVNAAFVPGGHRRLWLYAAPAAAPDRPRGPGQGPAPRGIALRVADAGAAPAPLLVAVVGTLAYNFQVVLALFARFTFHGGAGATRLSDVAHGGGRGGRGTLVAHPEPPEHPPAGRHRDALRRPDPGRGGLAPTMVLAAVLLRPHGGGLDRLHRHRQRHAAAAGRSGMRGRVMALYAIAFLGTTPIGGPLVGWIAQVANPRVALAVGGGHVAASISLAMRFRS